MEGKTLTTGAQEKIAACFVGLLSQGRAGILQREDKKQSEGLEKFNRDSPTKRL